MYSVGYSKESIETKRKTEKKGSPTLAKLAAWSAIEIRLTICSLLSLSSSASAMRWNIDDITTRGPQTDLGGGRKGE